MSTPPKSHAANLKDKLELPLITAPMFLISNPALALAACKEGIVGSFPALNQRTAEGLDKWLTEMDEGVAELRKNNPESKIAPYAVNLIVHKSNPRLEEDLALLVKHKVPIVITSLGAAKEVVDAVHSYGGIVLHDVTNIDHAKKAIAAGVDGLIAVSAGAGGHAGTMNPIALVNELRSIYDGIIVLAGGLTTGRDVLAAEAMGADFAYMGTRFICTTESSADPAYKQMILDAKPSDIIYTSAVSGVPANFLKDSLAKAGFDVEQLKKEGSTAGKLKPVQSEAAAWKTIWSAGQGAVNIKDAPSVATLAGRLKQEYADAEQEIANRHAARQKPVQPKRPASPGM
ncbi:MAG TPA: nitronate monooxygenase family protein [Patescibacteria group bacterium]|nr:nitronate monooxygenase family protein [Patescibacteria group bacterium]